MARVAVQDDREVHCASNPAADRYALRDAGDADVLHARVCAHDPSRADEAGLAHRLLASPEPGLRSACA